jgi:protein TonB
MKAKTFTVILLSALFISPAFAADRIVLESIPVPPSETGSASMPIGSTLVDDGKLIAKAGPVFTQGGDYTGMTLPYLISSPKPIRYPRWAIQQGWEGRFVLAVEIKLDGSVGRTKVMQSTGRKMLDEAATNAVSTWKFKPAVKNGKDIVTCIEIPVVFELSEK